MPIETGLVELSQRPLAELESIAIAGESAALVGEALARAGGPPLVVEADHFALLSRSADPPAPSRLRDLDQSSVDLVVLRRAWQSVADVGAALRAAASVTRVGGEVLAADIDVSRLLMGPSARYPTRLLYLAEPAAARRLESSTASTALLGMEAVRSRLASIQSLTYDDVRGRHGHVSELWEAVRSRGWRGAAWTPSDRLAELYEEVAASMAGAIPVGEAVDREPWYAVAGTRR